MKRWGEKLKTVLSEWIFRIVIAKTIQSYQFFRSGKWLNYQQMNKIIHQLSLLDKLSDYGANVYN